MTFVRINNLIFDPAHVAWVCQDEKDINKVTIHFIDGSEQFAVGSDASDVWAFFDDKRGWKDDES